MDDCKLSIDTLKSIHKEHNPEEDGIFRELYVELEEIDRRVSRTLSHAVQVRGISSTPRGRGGKGLLIRGGSRMYVRRGSGSNTSGAAAAMEDAQATTFPREPEYDDESNILSDGDYFEDDIEENKSSSSSSSSDDEGNASDMST